MSTGMCISSPTSSRVMERNERETEQSEEAVWQSIVQARVQDCLVLGDVVFQAIFEDFGKTVTDRNAFARTLEHLLHEHISIFTGRNPTVTSLPERRHSWSLVQGAFNKIDDVKRDGVEILRRRPQEQLPTGQEAGRPSAHAATAETSAPIRHDAPNRPTPNSNPLEQPSNSAPEPTTGTLRLHDETLPVPRPSQVAHQDTGAAARTQTIATTTTATTTTTLADGRVETPASAKRSLPPASASAAESASNGQGSRRDGTSDSTATGTPLPFSPIRPTKRQKPDKATGQDSSNTPASETSAGLSNPMSSTGKLRQSCSGDPTEVRLATVGTSQNALSTNVEPGEQLPQKNGSIQAQTSSGHKTGSSASSETVPVPSRPGLPSEAAARIVPPQKKALVQKVSADSNGDDLYADMDGPLSQHASDNRRSHQQHQSRTEDVRSRSIPPSGLSSKYTSSNGETTLPNAQPPLRRPDMSRPHDDRHDDASDMSFSDSSDHADASHLKRPSYNERRPPSPRASAPNGLLKCTEKDVLIAWGDRAESWHGNIYFMRRMNYYCRSESMEESEWMDHLICRAMQDVEKEGGRFLREYNSSPFVAVRDDDWFKLDRDDALDCLRKMLNEDGNFAWSPAMKSPEAASPDAQAPSVQQEDTDFTSCFDKNPHEKVWRCLLCNARNVLTEHRENHFNKCPAKFQHTLRRKSDPLISRHPPEAALNTRRRSESRYDGRHGSMEDRVSPEQNLTRATTNQRASRPFGKANGDRQPSSTDELLVGSEQYINKGDKTWWSCRICKSTFRPDQLKGHLLQDEHREKLEAYLSQERRKNATASLANSKEVRPTDADKSGPSKGSDKALKRASFPVKEDMGDTKLARTLCGRKVTNVTVDIDTPDDVPSVLHRLTEWDPFWENAQVVHVGVTTKVHSTVPPTDMIKTATEYYLPYPLREKINFSDLQWSRKRETSAWRSGDMALILKMLPIKTRAYKTKRADCHLWPKGTFIQVNGKPVQIEQRKQQEHNGGRDWKGQSQELDVTPHLDIGERNRIQICCFDDQPFAYALVCCKYRSSASLFRTLTDPTSKERIARLERNACIAKAKGIANQQLAESVESDVEVDESDRKFVISLTCPNSKLPMTTPVRGKLCNHFQCFDLDYFVRMNIRVSGTRWRCSPCDQFVSLESLEVCELTAGLLKEFKSVLSRTRDRVEVKADGSYVLLEERRERSKKRLNGAGKVDLQARTTTTAADPPVYELL